MLHFFLLGLQSEAASLCTPERQIDTGSLTLPVHLRDPPCNFRLSFLSSSILAFMTGYFMAQCMTYVSHQAGDGGSASLSWCSLALPQIPVLFCWCLGFPMREREVKRLSCPKLGRFFHKSFDQMDFCCLYLCNREGKELGARGWF